MGGDRRRRDSRSRSRGRRRRDRSRSRGRRRRRGDGLPDAKPEEKRRRRRSSSSDDDQIVGVPQGLSLTVVMRENPNLSVQEALAKLQIMKQMAGMNMAQSGQALAFQGALGAQLGGVASAPAMNGSGAAQGFALAAQSAATATATASLQSNKPKRELYVKNVPYGCTATHVRAFLDAALSTCKPAAKGAISNCWVAEDGSTAFLELRSIEETDSLFKLDGLTWGDEELKLGRPKNYGDGMAQPLPTMGAFGAGNPASLNPLMARSNVLMLLNLPAFLEEIDVKRIVCPFGALAEFNLLKDQDGSFKGAVVFKYEVDIAASNAIGGLNGRQLGDVKLVVQRVPPQMITTLMAPTKTGERPKPPPHDPEERTRVVHLRNAVEAADLEDDELYAELVDDVLQECGTFGDVDAVEIPRPDGEQKHPAQGSIFISFGDALFAEVAIEAFADRSLNNKTILAGYYPEDLFKEQRFDSIPLPPMAPEPAPAPEAPPDAAVLAARAVVGQYAGIGGVGAAPMVLAPPVVLAPGAPPALAPMPPSGRGRGVSNLPAWMAGRTDLEAAAAVDDMD